MTGVLDVRGGPDAIRMLREHGLRPGDVRVIVGASGGPKWLVLNGLDRHLLQHFVPDLQGPVHLLGSSIGTWRFACWAQADPLAALDRFEEAYLAQRYPEKVTAQLVTEEGYRILDHLLGEQGIREILDNARLRTNIVTVRGRHLVQADHRFLMLLGLVIGALSNLATRRLLGLSFERILFHVRSEVPARFHRLTDLPTRNVVLTQANLRSALMASASIPGVLAAVRGIPGAPPGTYYDGGVTDYHFDIPFHQSDGLVFYPHFYPRITPGWFDKLLHWRGPARDHYRNVLLVAPSAEFVASLPHGKIPDRNDFHKLDDEARLKYWRKVIDASRALGDAFGELLEKQEFGARVRPL